jgi:hypothetical protein
VRLYFKSDNEYTGGGEVGIYSSMMPTLLLKLSKASLNGSTGPILIGSSYLIRHESKILFLRCIESWIEGFGFIVTGSELEPTSCHQQEGIVVDEVLEILDLKRAPIFNHRLLNTIKPNFSVKLSGYSESVQVTTGVITNERLINQFPPLYFKVLCLYIINYLELSHILS